MPINNPYMEKVENDPNILTNIKEIYSHTGKWGTYFGNENPLVLEVGTGMGNFFEKQVSQHPEKNFIGMEIRYKRCFQTAEKARRASDPHFVILKDFGQNIDKIFSQEEISESYIFFPDPWANKKRQLKNRLLQEAFLRKLHDITKKGGKLFFKSDHREYFDSTCDIIQDQGLWEILHKTHDYENSEIFDMKNITEFEGFYRGVKTSIHYLELVKAH